MFKSKFFLLLILVSFSSAGSSQASPSDTELAVWANEAIVATYTYNYQNYLARQREIANYFTSTGWSAYSSALNASGLPAAVAKNAYFVSAVATFPPQIKGIDGGHWQATMPLLVVYKNPQYQQKQTLQVTIQFSQVPSGQGVRGLAISSLQSKQSDPICECKPEGGNESKENAPA